jgi:hypothetical protein
MLFVHFAGALLALYFAFFVSLLFTNAFTKWNWRTGFLLGVHGILLFLNIRGLGIWKGRISLLHDTYDL